MAKEEDSENYDQMIYDMLIRTFEVKKCDVAGFEYGLDDGKMVYGEILSIDFKKLKSYKQFKHEKYIVKKDKIK